MAALGDARDELADCQVCLELSAGIIHVLADRLVPRRVGDPSAERRVVGWLLSGRARASDVTEVMPYDIEDMARRVGYGLALAMVEMKEAGIIERPTRALLLATAEAFLPSFTERLEHEIAMTPCPASIPQREIDIVTALGRAWSAVEEQYEQAPSFYPADGECTDA